MPWVRVSRQSRKQRILRRVLLGLLVVWFSIAITIGLRRSADRPPDNQPAAQMVPAQRDPSGESLPSVDIATPSRPVFPYSVIPGGVLSGEELASAISKDRVVADHFYGFDLAQARLVKLQSEQFVHVSYRVKDKVYWTKGKVRLSEGEPLITDGREFARSRCGNMVAFLSQEPTLKEEPPVEIFEVPIQETMVPITPEIDLPVLTSPPVTLPNIEDPIPLNAVPRGTPGIPLTVPRTEIPPEITYVPEEPTDILPIPEPSTLVLVGSGLLICLAIRKVFKR